MSSTPKADTIRRKLSEARSELRDLEADLATLTTRSAEAEANVTRIVRQSDVADAKREDAVHQHAVAQRLVAAQQASIRDLASEIEQLEVELVERETADARSAAEKRLHEATTRLEELGRSFRDVIEAPQRRIAEAVVDALEAHQEAQAHGIEARQPRLTRYVKDADFPNILRPWLHQTLLNIDTLARNTLRDRRSAEKVDNASEREVAQQARVKEARKRMLRRLRERDHSGDHDRREALEAEVGAELDADLVAEAVA
jgi:hypothetical protein